MIFLRSLGYALIKKNNLRFKVNFIDSKENRSEIFYVIYRKLILPLILCTVNFQRKMF